MTTNLSAPLKRGFFDGMAIGMSGLCLVHCVALPVLLIALPNLSVATHWPEEMHLVAAILAGITCSAAILPRWSSYTQRQRLRIGGCALVGLLCLFGAITVHDHLTETIITVIGSLLLVAGHLQNLRA